MPAILPIESARFGKDSGRLAKGNTVFANIDSSLAKVPCTHICVYTRFTVKAELISLSANVSGELPLFQEFCVNGEALLHKQVTASVSRRPMSSRAARVLPPSKPNIRFSCIRWQTRVRAVLAGMPRESSGLTILGLYVNQ